MPRARADYTDKRFGKLVAKEVVGKDKYGAYIWKCICDCGNERELTTSSLTRMSSCGCLKNLNLVGQTFHDLTVISATTKLNGKKAWLCQCSCGSQHITVSNALQNGLTKSCGCKKEVNKRTDLTGHIFGRLSVLREVEGIVDQKQKWYECQCECGHLIHVRDQKLLSGHSKSCGCLKTDLIKERSTTHGLKNHYLYNTWKRMNDRCHNPSDPKYNRYHNKLNVRVCERWHRDNPDGLKNFIEDIETHLGPRPDEFYETGKPKYTLDRIKNLGGNYEIGNVRWATASEQNSNRNLEVA